MTAESTLGADALAADRLQRARAALKGAEVRMGAPSQGWEAPTLPCAERLDAVVPAGLRRGQVVSVTGSTSLMLALVAEASRDGAWTAMIGMPHVGVVAASRRGIELSRLALVPYPGIHAATAAGACLEGMEVVLLGEGLALSFADRRRLMTRARERGAVMVVAGPWEGAHTSLTVESHRWLGLGAGDGRLRERQLTVAVGGRAHGGFRRVTLTLDEDSGARWMRPGVRQALDEGVA